MEKSIQEIAKRADREQKIREGIYAPAGKRMVGEGVGAPEALINPRKGEPTRTQS